MENGAGWLITGSVLMMTDRLPCDTALGSSMTARFITTEPVRALMMTLAIACAGLTSRLSIAPRKATRSLSPTGVFTWITRPFERTRGVLTEARVDRVDARGWRW